MSYDMLLKGVSIYIAGILDILIGLFVLLKNPKAHKNMAFFLFTFSIGIWSIALSTFLVTNNKFVALLMINLVTISLATISASFYHLSASFVQKNFQIKKDKKIFGFYFLIIIALIGLGIPGFYIRDVVFYVWGKESLLGIGYYLLSFLYAIIVSHSFYKLWLSLKDKELNVNEKNIIRYLFFSMLIAIGFGSVFDWLFPLLNYYLYIWVGPYALFIVAGTMSYAITKHRLMDIKVVIGRTAALSLVSLAYLGVFAVLWIIPVPQAIQLSISLIYLIFTGLTFRPVWDATITTADKTFINGWYDYRIVQRKLSDKLKNVAEKHDILPAVQEILDNEMEIKDVQIVFLNHQDAGKLPLSLVEEIKESKEVALLPKGSILPKGVAIPCFLDGHLETIILAGPKRNEAPFNEVDFDLFRTLSSEVSVILQRSKPLEKALDRALTAEELAAKAEKEATLLKEVALQIQHEVKNPLAAIDLQTSLMPDHWEDKKWLAEHMIKIRKAIQIISATMDDLGEYGTMEVGEKYPADINAIIDEALLIWQSHFEKAGVKIEKNQGKLPLIKADPDSLKRVFLNLFVNAAQAMKAGGVLAVTTCRGQRQIKDKMVDAAVIKIKDTGEGIPEENRGKIFRMKFTTRYQGKGMGLPISYGIITKGHNGTISFESEAGKGTEFTIALPL